MVDIALIKELREKTFAPLKDCKESLEQANGDLVEAEKLLREKGALKAANKSDRATNEGVVLVRQEGSKIAGLKLACETDFVARNETFIGLGQRIVDELLKLDSLESYDKLDAAKKTEIETILKDNFVTIGENMQILEAFVRNEQAYVYRHPGDRVAAIVFYEGDADKAKQVALQAAAMNPMYLDVSEVPADKVSELTEMYTKEVKESGKPAEIVEKIVQGKLQKEWSDIVLLEQVSIVDDSKKVKELLGETKVTSFIRFAI